MQQVSGGIRGQGCPRPRFTAEKQRDAFQKPGVYVLTGPTETADLPEVYIGEGDPVRDRLERHHVEKGFWRTAFFFTSKDDHLNKAHVEYMDAIQFMAMHCFILAKRISKLLRDV